MIKKYIKKPVEIEAIQWTGNNLDEIISFVGIPNIEISRETVDQEFVDLSIITLEGAMHCSINDFIIKGVKGEFYPCKPDIFYETYIEKDV